MINKLTKKQENLLDIYKNKWLDIGLSTKRIDRKRATENFLLFNKIILNNKNKIPVLFFDSPLSAWIAVLLLNKNQVRNQVENQVRNQVRNQVENQVWNQMWNQVKNQIKNLISPYLCGSFDSSFFSFYDFIYSNLINMPHELVQKWNLYKWTSTVGLIYPFNNFCIISEKPTKITIKNGVLHNETEASVKYADGLEIYTLNGIQVTKEIVETAWNQLDSKLILTEKNAETRRAIVRKIGIEKICKDLNAKTIDTQGNYELLILDTQDRQRPYLKMENPSIGCYHIEGVPPECDTVEKALNSRKPDEMRKIPIDDVNGED